MNKLPHVVALDLAHLSRDLEDCRTEVYLVDLVEEKLWISAGAASLMDNHSGGWMLSSKLDATDDEHDRAYSFQLPLVGVTLSFVSNHTVYLNGWIDSTNPQRFRVPSPGRDPYVAAKKCGECKGSDSHRIVQADQWLPPHDAELFFYVRGCRVQIVLSTGSP
jgi:hypothetical protein